MPPTQKEWNAYSWAGRSRKYAGNKFKQKGLQGRRSVKVIMTSQFQRLVVPTTRFFKKLVIMLTVSSSCLSSDDHVILSSADKPFALSPSSFPPHWTRPRGCKKNTHTPTHFYSAKRVGRFPRWYDLPLSPLSLLLSHIKHTLTSQSHHTVPLHTDVRVYR